MPLPLVEISTRPPTADERCGVGVGVITVFVIVQLAGTPLVIGTFVQFEDA